MTSLTQDIKNKLSNLNVLEKIIVINVIIFLFANTFGLLYSTKVTDSLIWLELPSQFSELLYKPWSILSYAFVHYGFMHVLFNMFLLYIVAQWFVNLFSMKLALNIYLLGAISGGLLFVLAYTLFPHVLGPSRLVGASASVRALLVFLCAYMPTKPIRFFTINLKLWHLGIGVVIIDFLGVLGGLKQPLIGNPGGNIAHLGGALLGYIYAKQLVEKGNDIGAWFEPFVTSILNIFNTAGTGKKKKTNLRTVHKAKGKMGGYKKADFDAFNNQKQIDIILDKISKSGYDSLTSEEKAFLFRAGK